MTVQSLQRTFPSTAEGLRSATVTLNNGIAMPWLGLGVFQIPTDEQTEATVISAIEQGYRHIDTASIYGNERGVGQGIHNCGVPREKLFITTKLWNQDIREGNYDAAFERSMAGLGLEYIDLYLVHWPIGGKIVEAWQNMERLFQTGRIKAIGLSNHMRGHLNELLASAEIVPAVNQIEFHPYLLSTPLITYCQGKGIQLQAWSPLMQAGPILNDPALVEIASRHGKTVAQVILRWDLQMGVVTIPKSVNPARILENASVFDFKLSAEEVATISALDRGQRNGPDPHNFSF